ncbi:hypothetical protein AA101099_2581 [Neoasaia chiangmaiensis NBRC 101099]|uniref:Uncharacterized protein n=1 Tax=Neoasaia chiangmaiensis TaxID=320497 RepID=A0A1U9KPK6_9PROT|nr:hypothetical protein [Neoasaia chiangmaiensis]AQS87746.1 hypothetical protein A0U93_07145 [Neoasaia chiangmaiensis]GBR41682.1 hypothetical protein AA101099_2581 [Neoasaia chiangmaiensis NBRC 101099]GEN14342.1 hypothetical protein NCH01_07730 [Neoasaia chiangmaiensis]
MADRLIRHAVGVLLFCAMAQPARSAPDPLCGALHRTLLPGKGADWRLKDILPDAVEASEMPAPPDAAHLMPDDSSFTLRYYHLVEGRLGALQRVAGTLHCAETRFVSGNDGHLQPMPYPAGIRKSPCWDDTLWLGRVRGVPYVVEDERGAGDRARALRASGWRNGRWTPVCHVKESYAVRLEAETSGCRAGAPCNELARTALELAQAAQRDREHRIGPWQQDRTDNFGTDHPTLPVFGVPPINGYTTMYAPVSSDRAIDGQRYRMTVGGGMIGWRIYPGWLVRVTQLDADGHETPVAGYQFARRPDTITSLTIAP